MRISSRGITRQPTPAMDAKPAFAKGVIRTPNKPRGKFGVEKAPPHENNALRDFTRNRAPQDASRPDGKDILGRIRRGFERGGGEATAARGGVTDAARAEAQGQRGALWGRLREMIESRFHEQRGEPVDKGDKGGNLVRELEPEVPMRIKAGRIEKPAIIRTPSRTPRSTSNPI